MHMRTAVPSVFLVLMMSASVLAQTPPSLPGNYPSRPIKIIGGGTPGGGTDIVARLLAQKVTEKWGRPMIVENHPSVMGGIVAMELTAKAPPDGYTMFLAASSAIINGALVAKVPYDIRTAFAPIAKLTSQPYVLVVNNAVPAKSVKELIAYARSRKGELDYGSTGSGSATHLGMELFKLLAGLDMQHIPYKGGGQAQIDLLGGQVQLMFASAIAAIPQVRLGKLRILGTGSPKRSRLLPDVPTIAESGLPGFELVGWYGLATTTGTPTAIVAALNRESIQIMNSPEMQAKLIADGAEAAEPNTPAEFAKAIDDEIDRWDKVIKSSNLKFER